ncbi:DUF4760 domain-containing protein [Jejuia spongiicola]|uniref:DUF4760 domain-containing protein n=1 Tax=Jejuia spongiicola TaxID=2942207 RepID=A0ABT0QBM5_9FLAO|nr:hypothetical protein [Jejuia spongiicola]MCL6293674.1 hypothetical protein [Jejuia spongiicola]
MEDYELFISIFSALFALLALIISLRQFQISKNLSKLNYFMELMKEYRSDKFRQRRLLAKTLSNPDIIFYDLPNEKQDEIIQLSHFFDNLGFLVWNKMIPKKIVDDFIGENIDEFWQLLSPIIQKRREGNSIKKFSEFSRYQDCFEYLATGKKPTSYKRA